MKDLMQENSNNHKDLDTAEDILFIRSKALQASKAEHYRQVHMGCYSFKMSSNCQYPSYV